ncbi:hypothetical protein WH47_04801 [Habropoda laboriosa]|uniref:Neuroparsin-A n=1 Tax=Habropoda laboriosa TaxID=597456 RepID=A0A0L7QXM6_9HYME|nr:hypothetical protein WH47_04801 [Habropoda laboriosa]
MPESRTIRIAILLAVVLLFDKCSGYPSIMQEVGPHCKGCGDSCQRCEFGVVMSNDCNIPQCAMASDRISGPGQSCGKHSICGEGMYCSCNNRCVGCSSKTFACSTLDPCVHPYANRFGRLSITTVA